MTLTRLKTWLSGRIALAMLAGILWALAFEKFGVAGFAWVAPGTLLAAALGRRGWAAFRVGYFGGLTFYLVLLYWLLLIPYRWHGIPFGPALGWLALSAFMALYPATWAWLAATYAVPKLNLPAQPTVGQALRGLGEMRWSGRMRLALLAAAFWVGLEMVQGRFLSGFPWNFLGSTQYRMLPLIQCAAVTGVYGISFLLVWTSACGLSAVGRSILGGGRSGWAADMVVPLAIVALVYAQGFRSIRAPEISGRTWRALLVQPSIPQTLIWNSDKDDERFAELLALSEQGMTNHPQVVIWPEAAVPKLLRYDEKTFEAVSQFARHHQVWMIVGADDAEPPATKPGPKEPQALFYNSSFLISPEGKLRERYRKRALVIFGEYIPLVKWLPFLQWFTPIEGGFTPGNGPVPFELEEPPVKASVLICFEDIFPHLVREYVSLDTDVLVNLTNNGWFGESAAQWQHGASAVLRAVENNLPLVRCANNGLTCMVDRHGNLRQVFQDEQGSIYGRGTMLVEVPLPISRGPATFYTSHGDVFGWACVCLTALPVLAGLAARRGKTPQATH